MPRRSRVIAGFLLLWLFLGVIMVLLSWPSRPRTTVGWVTIFVFGPPLYLAGEALFGWLLSPQHGRRLSKATFSPLRFSVALACALLAFGAIWFLARSCSSG